MHFKKPNTACPEKRNHVCDFADCPCKFKYSSLQEEMIKGRFANSYPSAFFLILGQWLAAGVLILLMTLTSCTSTGKHQRAIAREKGKHYKKVVITNQDMKIFGVSFLGGLILGSQIKHKR
jgi:hypothetical protein